MAGLWRKWFGQTGEAGAGSAAVAPASAAVAPGVREDESLDALYEEFRRTFTIRPGVKLIDFLEAEGVTQLIAWLQPSTPCALPKGFIRLAVDMTRKGNHVWEQRKIVMRYEGNWDRGGLPEQESLDAVSVLAQVLEKPITLYYTETPDGPLMVKIFEPR